MVVEQPRTDLCVRIWQPRELLKARQVRIVELHLDEAILYFCPLGLTGGAYL